MKKVNPSKTEVDAALAVQAPPQSFATGDEAPPTALQRVSTFKQLAKVSRNSRLAFGTAGQWIKPDMLFNQSYRDGFESPPFFITKAFKYKSKEIQGDRLGLEIVLSNGRSYLMGLGLNENDAKRMGILNMFQNQFNEPVGPFVVVMLPTGKGNDYYDLVPYEQKQTVTDADIEIPFVEIEEEIPF